MMTEGTNLPLLTISAFWSLWAYKLQKAEKYPIRWSLYTGFTVLDIDISQGPLWPIELCNEVIFPKSEDFHSTFCYWILLDLFCYGNFDTVGCAFGVPICSSHTGYKASCFELCLNIFTHLSQLSSGNNPLTTNYAQGFNAPGLHNFLQPFTSWNDWKHFVFTWWSKMKLRFLACD